MGAPSITSMPDAPMLRHDDIVYMHELVDRIGDLPHSHYQVPAYATDLSGLPQAIVVTGECDPIRDWGERYADRLRHAGVQTTLTRYPGMYHGFLMRSDATARGRLAMAEVGALVRAKFAHPHVTGPSTNGSLTQSASVPTSTVDTLTTEGEHHADR
jgi:acetyl esterase